MSIITELRASGVPNTATFGMRLAMVRHEMRWNFAEAALACDIPEANWREWELNGRKPRDIAAIAYKISQVANVGGEPVDDYWLSTGRAVGGNPGGPGTITRRYSQSRRKPHYWDNPVASIGHTVGSIPAKAAA